MNYCLYLIFKDFQSLIVGIIGFSGVMLTLYINARIGRTNIKNGIEHERNMLKNALSSELDFSLTLFQKMVTPSNMAGQKVNAFYPEETPQLVYKAFISKLGLLSSEQAAAVITAYALINELPMRLMLFSDSASSENSKKGYIYISENHEKNALNSYKMCIPSIEHALESLKNKA